MPAKSYTDMVAEAEAQLDGDNIDMLATDESKHAVLEGLRQLQDKKNPFSVSDLTPHQIMLIHKLKALAVRYPFAGYDELADMFGLLLWSKNRSSRGEIKDILSAFMKASKKKMFGRPNEPQSQA